MFREIKKGHGIPVPQGTMYRALTLEAGVTRFEEREELRAGDDATQGHYQTEGRRVLL